MRRAILRNKVSRKEKEVKAKDAEKSFAVFALFFPTLREKTLNKAVSLPIFLIWK